MGYPSLARSYRKAFPFKICTTSFIYPDLYAPNVEMLGPFLDEIELLFFESRYKESLPDRRQIDEILKHLTRSDMTCNVHLPLDIDLGDADAEKRNQAVSTIRHIIRLTAPLDPSTYTVHFNCDQNRDKKRIKSWQAAIAESMDRILSENIAAEKFSVENLVSYPFEWADEIIEKMGLHVCMDFGHLAARNENFEAAYEKYGHVTDILHIYGITEEKDHQGLNVLAENYRRPLEKILKTFTGTVSVEVFSFEALSESLKALETWNICRHRTAG